MAHSFLPSPRGWADRLAHLVGRFRVSAPSAVRPATSSIAAVRPSANRAPRSWRGASARTAVVTCCGTSSAGRTHEEQVPAS